VDSGQSIHLSVGKVRAGNPPRPGPFRRRLRLVSGSTAGFGLGLGVQGVVAGEMLQLGVDKTIALQLAVDGGAVAAEVCCDLENRHPDIMPAGYLATGLRPRWTEERGTRLLL